MAGCGGSAGPAGSESPMPTSSAPRAAAGPAGPHLGQCGSVTDAEVAAATGMPQPMRAVRDTVGCQWDVGTLGVGSHVSFTWYRGSPIGRERAIDNAVGRDVSDVTIGGRPGFSSRIGPSLCEVGVDYGADFFLWSVDYGADTAGPPEGGVCDAATSLAAMTAERAQ
ncbi:DUF3558 domain-containing protein [Tomitella fengzijianii]|uniref:DUF3558 domain-containing protein n=1 Tax=Tomitella fengzijianii TaxID=2597660 RepID=UPI0022A86F24|nr:DUF3558 domain-containing protein [Tomitella fengzijianii]